MKIHTIKRWSRVILMIIVGSFCILCVGFFLMYALVSLSGPLARSLAPSQYPGSTLLSEFVSGGTTLKWDRKLYSTPDSLDEVLLFMEGENLTFELKDLEGTEAGVTTYTSKKCSNSWLGRYVALFGNANGSSLPCASTWIFNDPDQLEVTFIEIWISWPSP